MTNSQNPIEELASQISSVQSDINGLQDDIRLTHLRSEVEQIENTANSLPQIIAGLRGRGYAYDKGLEARADDIKSRWNLQRMTVLTEITRQTSNLDIDMRGIENMMYQLNARAGDPNNANPMLTQLKSAISSMESKVTAAEDAVKAMVSSYSNDLNAIKDRLGKVDWMLTQLSQACFQLMPTEAAAFAVEVVSLQAAKESSDDPKGILYLTDQRLIFEQKQEIATKKFLFIATEKQKVQKLVFEVPVSLIESIIPSKQGLFGHEDHLELGMGSGASVRGVHLHLLGQDCNQWQGQINLVKTGDLDKNRAVAVDQGEVEKVKLAPTQCPVCGGAITTPVLRGMDSIKCEYCGNVIRL